MKSVIIIVIILFFELLAFSEEKTTKETKKMPPPLIDEIVMEALVVEGRIQKPRLFIILGRGDLHYKGLDEKKSFVEDVIKSVENNPF